MRAQKYILNADDVINASLVTTANKEALEDGGLFKNVTMYADAVVSADFSLRSLYDAAGVVTLDWNTKQLNGNWEVSGDLHVGGIITGTFEGDLNLTNLNLTTDDLPEGQTNKYCTTELVGDSVNELLVVQAPLTYEYDDNANVYSLGFAGIAGLTVTQNTIHVGKSGTDNRVASESKYDVSDPFLTVVAATDAASAGDLIVVWPGIYNNEVSLLKDGVNYYFHHGASIVNQSGLVNDFMFKDTGVISSNVYGYGSFIGQDAQYPSVIKLVNTGSRVEFNANTMQCTVLGSSVVNHVHGDLLIVADKILSVGDAITSFDNTLIVKNAYIQGTDPASYGLMVNGATAEVLLDNCQLEAVLGAVSIIDNNSTTKIKNTLMVTEGPYSVTTEAGSTPTVRLLAGVCSNKAVDPNVITDPLAPFTVDDNFTITII